MANASPISSFGSLGIIPVALWGALKWFGNESANILECWALYGYANLIWIPVALISWSPILSMYWSSQFNVVEPSCGVTDCIHTVLNYVFVAIGFGVSALFLFRNLYVYTWNLSWLYDMGIQHG